jgi:hypothetical protein
VLLELRRRGELLEPLAADGHGRRKRGARYGPLRAASRRGSDWSFLVDAVLAAAAAGVATTANTVNPGEKGFLYPFPAFLFSTRDERSRPGRIGFFV